MPPSDTIFALSSGRPPAAIAVVRVSGLRAGPALAALIGRVPEPRRAALARVCDPASGEALDEALALWFPGPSSETGEDIAELQLHGSRAVVAGVLAALGRIEGLRPAEAGEFTRRAFENGRLDLTAVEGLADLIHAETAAQRRQAFRHLKGFLGERAETWRARLVQALALVEARIDFSDEADVPEDLSEPALTLAEELRHEMSGALAGAARGERLREGLVVAIAGPPNAGKSTLLNRIARREVAIVSPHPGTTRDVIEVHLDLGGYPVTLLDTAGVRDSEDAVEQEGVRRARARAAAADLVLWVVDGALVGQSQLNGSLADWPLARRSLADQSSPDAPADDSTHPPLWIVRNKVDLFPLADHPASEREFTFRTFPLSAVIGTGVPELLDALAAHARTFFETGEPALIARARHRHALEAAVAAIDRAIGEGRGSGREDLVAEDLRLAARALGRLTGRVDVEDVLDVIFRDFCIGK